MNLLDKIKLYNSCNSIFGIKRIIGILSSEMDIAMNNNDATYAHEVILAAENIKSCLKQDNYANKFCLSRLGNFIDFAKDKAKGNLKIKGDF